MRDTFVNFPSQAVSDLEKVSMDYGLKVAKAIEHQGFSESTNKFKGNSNNFHKTHL